MQSNTPDELAGAIFRTVAYGDVFYFPMKPSEIHHYLISSLEVSLQQIEDTLVASAWLQQRLYRHNGYVALAGREELVSLREQREQAARHLWPLANRYGRWLAALPFVRMVALTGALAVRNPAGKSDDLDYLLVTAEGRVWVARAFAILVVRIARLFGTEVCPNYVLAESALLEETQNLYIAHEVAQVVPIFGYDYYQRFREVNSWVAEFLPNAKSAYYSGDVSRIGVLARVLKRFVEAILSSAVGQALEQWELRRKVKRFSPEVEQPESAAKVDAQRVKGHFNDHGHRVLDQYQERLHQHPEVAQLAGHHRVGKHR